MSEWNKPIARVRDAVCAVLKIRGSENQSGRMKWEAKIVGTAWCIVPNRYFVTACHIFDDRENQVINPRKPDDKFLMFAVPNNGTSAFHTSVVGFPCERPDVDMAIMEIAPSGDFPSIPSINVTFKKLDDGEKVLTYGFAAPEIQKFVLEDNGDWKDGNLRLFAHANEGIVAAQYGVHPGVTYAFNIGWHPGESGGPIIRLDSCAAFAVMQNYIDIPSPHPHEKQHPPHQPLIGPHQGISLAAIEEELRAVGAIIV